MTVRELYKLCKEYGARALEARRKFAGLLPEVYRREFKSVADGGGRSWLGRRGYSCIYEFAARLAGMSREQVDQVLRLDRRFEDKAVLRKALVSGEVSANKLVRIASIATSDNQEDLFEKVKVMSQKAVEVYVNDVKNQEMGGSSKGLFDGESLRAHCKTTDINSDVKLMEKLSGEVKVKLLELDEKGLDVNRILIELLGKREREIEESERVCAKEVLKGERYKVVNGVTVSRYIPVKVRRLVEAQFGNKCFVNGCERRAEELHHEKEFAKWRTHDPRWLRPLCKGHHEVRHSLRFFGD